MQKESQTQKQPITLRALVSGLVTTVITAHMLSPETQSILYCGIKTSYFHLLFLTLYPTSIYNIFLFLSLPIRDQA